MGLFDIQYTITVESDKEWRSKVTGVILVKNRVHINIIHKILIQQDDYWDEYKHLIQVKPEIINERTLTDLIKSNYTGKTSIYDIDEFFSKLNKLGIDIFIFCREEDGEELRNENDDLPY